MNTSARVLFVAWYSHTNRAIYPVARLVVRTEQPRYEFSYVHGVHDALAHGFMLFARMGSLERAYLSEELFPLLGNRVMSSSRPDFPEYVEQLGLAGIPEPALLLARSEGRKMTDNLEVFAPPEFDAVAGRWVYSAFVRGVRHLEGAEQAVAGLHPGELLSVEPELTNEWDARALLVIGTDRVKVGWVPHTLVEDINQVLDLGGRVVAEVVRVNLAPAPVHQRLLVRILADHREGFRPLATVRYQPMAAGATVVPLEPVADLR